MFVVVFIIGLNKICAKHSTLKGFYRGLGVVKGKGVASAKKALPFPLKERKIFKVFKINKGLFYGVKICNNAN